MIVGQKQWSEIAKKTSFDNVLHVVDEYKEPSADIFVLYSSTEKTGKNEK